MKARYRVGLIGLGGIGADYDTPEDDAIRTHLKACLAEPRFELCAVADADQSRSAAAAQAWKLDCPILAPPEFMQRHYDLVCIATPTATHIPMLQSLLDRPPRLVLCEKPLGEDRVAARTVLDGLSKAGTVVAVNYMRHWLPGLDDWLLAAGAGSFGRPLAVNARYSRGFRNNGSHLFSLVAAALQPTDALVLHERSPVNDGVVNDATRSLLIELTCAGAAVPFWLLGIDGRRQTAFGIELLFEDAAIVVEDRDGIRARLDRATGTFGHGFANELRASVEFHDAPPRLLATVWSNLADCLDGSGRPACTGALALAAADLMDRLAA